MSGFLERAYGYRGDAMNLPVPNVEAAIAFYTSTLGFRVVSREQTPHASVVLARDAIQMRLAENGGDPTQDGCAFHVTDLATLFTEFTSNGLGDHGQESGEGSVSPPVFDTEQHGGVPWRVFYVVAPDGLCFWFGERQR